MSSKFRARASSEEKRGMKWASFFTHASKTRPSHTGFAVESKPQSCIYNWSILCLKRLKRPPHALFRHSVTPSVPPPSFVTVAPRWTNSSMSSSKTWWIISIVSWAAQIHPGNKVWFSKRNQLLKTVTTIWMPSIFQLSINPGSEF